MKCWQGNFEILGILNVRKDLFEISRSSLYVICVCWEFVNSNFGTCTLCEKHGDCGLALLEIGCIRGSEFVILGQLVILCVCVSVFFSNAVAHCSVKSRVPPKRCMYQNNLKLRFQLRFKLRFKLQKGEVAF